MQPMRTTIRVSALSLAVAAALFAPEARALGPLDLEVGAKAGVGTTPGGVPSGYPNPLGFGLGARAGVSIIGLYGGLSFMYYFGGSSNVQIPTGAGVISVSESVNSLLYGVEGGYGTKLGPLALRGTVGIGNIGTTASASGVSQTQNGLYIEPGVTGIFSIGIWFVGADANVLVLPSYAGGSSLEAAFTLHGQFGVTF
jgi:hypothetical protein